MSFEQRRVMVQKVIESGVLAGPDVIEEIAKLGIAAGPIEAYHLLLRVAELTLPESPSLLANLLQLAMGTAHDLGMIITDIQVSGDEASFEYNNEDDEDMPFAGTIKKLGIFNTPDEKEQTNG